MALLAPAQALRLEIPQDPLARLGPFEARVGGAGGRRHPAVETDATVHELEAVPLAASKSFGS